MLCVCANNIAGDCACSLPTLDRRPLDLCHSRSALEPNINKQMHTPKCSNVCAYTCVLCVCFEGRSLRCRRPSSFPHYMDINLTSFQRQARCRSSRNIECHNQSTIIYSPNYSHTYARACVCGDDSISPHCTTRVTTFVVLISSWNVIAIRRLDNGDNRLPNEL